MGSETMHKGNCHCSACMSAFLAWLRKRERCFKKLYEGKRGLHFKHTGYSPMYLDDFTASATVIPFQVLYPTPKDPHPCK